jgi:hypothetical protein
MLGVESRDKWTIGSRWISESNQLVGRILGIEVDGLGCPSDDLCWGVPPDLHHYS